MKCNVCGKDFVQKDVQTEVCSKCIKELNEQARNEIMAKMLEEISFDQIDNNSFIVIGADLGQGDCLIEVKFIVKKEGFDFEQAKNDFAIKTKNAEKRKKEQEENKAKKSK